MGARLSVSNCWERLSGQSKNSLSPQTLEIAGKLNRISSSCHYWCVLEENMCWILWRCFFASAGCKYRLDSDATLRTCPVVSRPSTICRETEEVSRYRHELRELGEVLSPVMLFRSVIHPRWCEARDSSHWLSDRVKSLKLRFYGAGHGALCSNVSDVWRNSWSKWEPYVSSSSSISVQSLVELSMFRIWRSTSTCWIEFRCVDDRKVSEFEWHSHDFHVSASTTRVIYAGRL